MQVSIAHQFNSRTASRLALLKLEIAIVAFAVFGGSPYEALGQNDTASDTTVRTVTTEPTAIPAHIDQNLLEQIELLSSDNYRARQQARWHLENSPIESLRAIEVAIGSASLNSASQMVDLLSSFAMHSDAEISRAAQKLLSSLANSVTSVGRLANNTLRALSDLQEANAYQIIESQGGRFSDSSRITLNRQQEFDRTLRLEEGFRGDRSVLEQVQYLKSIRGVVLSGQHIDPVVFESIAKLKQLTTIKLHNLRMTNEELELLGSLEQLESISINYIDLDDTVVPTLLSLPLSQSLRLYGTKVSAQGANQLTERFPNVQVFVGKGGFLGVGTLPNNTVISQVKPALAADLAGIQLQDELTHVNGIAIANFDDLRNELGKYSAEETIEIQLKRMEDGKPNLMTVVAKLGKDPEWDLR